MYFRPNCTSAEMAAVMGTVTAHAAMILLNSDQSTDSLERTRPVITTEPTLQCVDETGMFNRDAPSTVIALASSMTKPLEGVIFVKSSPIVFITRLPIEVEKLSFKINDKLRHNPIDYFRLSI